MSAFVLLAGTLFAQALPAAAIPAGEAAAVRSDVAYGELSDGRSLAAIAKLEAGPEVRGGDPAALINLGTAYARAGMHDKAIAAYRAAADSDARYDLQLADGSWMDSRQAARTALAQLLNRNAQASR